MRATDKARFVGAMNACADAFGKTLPNSQLALWWSLMSPFDIADFERALHQHLLDPERGRFMPVPADIVRQIEGTGGDRAALAWTKVRSAIQRVGPYRSVAFDDPLIHCVVEDMGGWVSICGMASDEAPFRGKEFSDRYRAYAVRRDGVNHPAVLMGEHDLANRLRFPEAVKPPVLVGDPDKAATVAATTVLPASALRPPRALTQATKGKLGLGVRAAIKIPA